MSWRDGPLAAKWLPVLNTYEIAAGIPYDLLARQCYEESHFNPEAINPKSCAIGLMQLLPADFPGAGKDPVADIGKGGQYLKKLYGMFGNDWQLALAAYDWGPGNMRKWRQDQGTFATLPKETRDYVSKIISDVPVEGSLCKVQSPISPPVGSPAASSLPAASSVKLPPKSLWQSATSILRPRSPPNSPQPSLLSVTQPLHISSPIHSEVSMSTPNPTSPAPSAALVAASPFLKILLGDLKVAVNTTLSGDPLQIGLRAGPAFGIFLNQLLLMEPSLAGAEVGAINTTIASQIDGVIAKLP
jgi:hypothetical protein